LGVVNRIASTQANSRGFWTLPALDNIDNDGLAFAESGDARSIQGRDMNEHILPAAIPSDEAVALVGVEPFHRAGLLDPWPVQCRRLGIRPP